MKSSCVKTSPSFSPISISNAPKKCLPIWDLNDGCSEWIQNTQNIPLIAIVFGVWGDVVVKALRY